MSGDQKSPAEISQKEFLTRLKELLDSPVTRLDAAGRHRLAAGFLADLAASVGSGRRDRPSLELIPFSPGRRPIDEALHDGYGCSEQVGVLSTAPDRLSLGDEIWLLYQIKQLETLPDGLTPGDLSVRMSLWFVPPMPEMGEAVPVPGQQDLPVPPQVVSAAAYPQHALEPAFFGQAEPARFVARIVPGEQLVPGSGWTWESAAESLRQRTPDGADPFTFAHLFHQRVRVDLALCARGEPMSSQSTEIEVYDAARFGSLYARLIEKLVKPDTAAQAARLGGADWHHGHHPWFPVLGIGSDKASLYMQAIFQDLVQQWDNLPDPRWLLRVSLYLEFLTCLGVFLAVRAEYPDLLSEAEWQVFKESPHFAEIRDRVHAAAWKKVWQLRGIAPPSADFLSAGPVSFKNLLNKQRATRAFLRAHHDDLKHAIELAGANTVHAQETWHRVFRDAERAVLKNSLRAFPELRTFGQRSSDFVFWHQKGRLRLFGVNVAPEPIASLFGDQDGVFPSACRQYRDSMNEVARWASKRGLMDYTGGECIPRTASLLEAYLADDRDLLGTLQKRDGYGPALELSEPLPREAGPSRKEIAALLRGIQIFDPLMDDEIRSLAERVRPKRFGPHDRVVLQGQPGDSLFVVAAGKLEVLVRQPDGHDLPIDLREPGSVFGEIGLLAGGERTATVRAVSDVVLYEIARRHLQPIIAARPQLIRDLCTLMTSRRANIHRQADQYQSEHEQIASLAARMSAFFLGGGAPEKIHRPAAPPAPGPGPAAASIPAWDDVEAFLQSVPAFGPLHADELRALAGAVRLVRCQPFDRIITQGQPGASLFVVAAGTFDVLVRQPDGHDLLVSRLQPGSVFGEIALLTGGERIASVRAATDGILYEIGREQLQPIIAARPEIIVELSVLMANRQAETSELSQRHAAADQAKSLASRIRAFLLGAPGG